MTRHTLLTIPAVAELWGESPAAVQRAAEEAGLLVRIGRKPKIYEADLERLVRKCQGQAKAQDYTGASRPKREAVSGLSSTAKASARQAQTTVDKLTKRLPTTSTRAAPNVTPLRPKPS